jgi:hypothetical protein
MCTRLSKQPNQKTPQSSQRAQRIKKNISAFSVSLSRWPLCSPWLNSSFCAILISLILASAAAAQPVNIRMMGGMPTQGPGVVNLPYMTPDNSGGMWYVYNDGALRQQMAPAVYAQGAMLTIDGNNFTANGNQGTLTKAGELILRNPNMADGLTIVRRVFFDKSINGVRYADVLRSTSGQDQTVTVNLQTTLNWGITQGQVIADPHRKDQNLAWTGMTNMGRAVLEVFGGTGGKIQPTIAWQNGGNVVQASYSVLLPAGKTIVLMHLHMFVPTLDAGERFVSDLKTSKLLSSLPLDLRKEVGNFAAAQEWLTDLEILRGDVFDVVELHGGDVYKGTLAETDYKLDTFSGTVDLSPDRVVAMTNVGQSRPRQLLITDDGEIFGGQLAKQTIDMTLTSGQVVHFPLQQINRIGYRKRPSEPDEWTFEKPMVLMRGGDRVFVQLPEQKIQVATRYGTLALDPAGIAAIVFQPDDSTGVHEIYLTDGSHLAGLVIGDDLEMRLDGAGPQEPVHFPVSDMLRLQLIPKTPDADPDAPSLELANQDQLRGSLLGQFSLQTAFDSISLDGGQIRHITRVDSGGGPSQVQVTLWDGSVISGQITDATVACRLLSGVDLAVSVSQISEYNQPHPLPSQEVIKQIETAVTGLSADDWRDRDRAEAALKTMGPAVIGVLEQMRAKQPPEAQQRIDAIIKELQPAAKAAADATPPPAPGDDNGDK